MSFKVKHNLTLLLTITPISIKIKLELSITLLKAFYNFIWVIN